MTNEQLFTKQQLSYIIIEYLMNVSISKISLLLL